MAKRKSIVEIGDHVSVDPADSIKATGQFAYFTGTVVGIRKNVLGVQRVTVVCDNGYRHTFDRSSILTPYIG